MDSLSSIWKFPDKLRYCIKYYKLFLMLNFPKYWKLEWTPGGQLGQPHAQTARTMSRRVLNISKDGENVLVILCLLMTLTSTLKAGLAFLRKPQGHFWLLQNCEIHSDYTAVQRGYLRVWVEIPGISSKYTGVVWICLKFNICLLLCLMCFVGRNLLTNFTSSYIFYLSFQLYFQSNLFIKHTVVCWQNSLLHFKCSTYYLVSAGCFIYFLENT